MQEQLSSRVFIRWVGVLLWMSLGVMVNDASDAVRISPHPTDNNTHKIIHKYLIKRINGSESGLTPILYIYAYQGKEKVLTVV